MNPILKNVLAVVGGILGGGLLNSLLVSLGPSIIPLPEGADVSNMENLAEAMSLFGPENFIFPFLGHALGTLFGAYVAARLAANNHMKFALGIGVFFLLGGISAVIMLGGPLWFKVMDLALAYIPMGWLGGKLAMNSINAD